MTAAEIDLKKLTSKFCEPEIGHIIKKLKYLQLDTFPFERILYLISRIGRISLMVTEFKKGDYFERAVNNTKEKPEFSEVNRISMKPVSLALRHERASFKNTTAFYGSYIPKNLEKEEIKYARAICAFEVNELLRRGNKEESGIRTITFGKWKLKCDLKLVTIFYPDDTFFTLSYIYNLKVRYNKFLKGLEATHAKKSKEFLSFISKQYSRFVSTDKNYNYLISACFGNLIVIKGLDGILYPSVQTIGQGLCVAINPVTAKKCLELERVLQCKIIKNSNNVELKNEKYCLVEPSLKKFKLIEIKEEDYFIA